MELDPLNRTNRSRDRSEHPDYLAGPALLAVRKIFGSLATGTLGIARGLQSKHFDGQLRPCARSQQWRLPDCGYPQSIVDTVTPPYVSPTHFRSTFPGLTSDPRNRYSAGPRLFWIAK